MKNKIRVVILAGGEGKRLREIISDLPKPMVDICGKPLLHRQLDWLISQGVEEVTISIGYKGDKIRDYFSNGENFGIKINYIVEAEPLGTAGSLVLLEDFDGETLFFNGDILFDMSLVRLLEHHREKRADITIVTHPNDHPYDSSLVDVSDDGRVRRWYDKGANHEGRRNIVNAGVHILSPCIVEKIKRMNVGSKIDFDGQVLKPHLDVFRIFAYQTPEYIKDIGTPDRYAQACEDFKLGVVGEKNLAKKQKAIFLDRDGTINKYKGFVREPNQLELEEGVIEAIKNINRSGFLAIVITNQPVVARGECTFYELETIHDYLEALLGEGGAYLDGIFYCPHHPDKGYEGEVTNLKLNCECRKPKPGLLYQAADYYNIDLTNSYMVGDSISDIVAGQNAGCMSGFISERDDWGERFGGAKLKFPDYFGKDLREVVEIILNDYNKNTI